MKLPSIADTNVANSTDPVEVETLFSTSVNFLSTGAHEAEMEAKHLLVRTPEKTTLFKLVKLPSIASTNKSTPPIPPLSVNSFNDAAKYVDTEAKCRLASI
eukprot:GHVU01026909.1.p2 GENE.GHVU01026909.1~~GHVU01026909.1.p2  ORF type:complete len:101 (-),score=5.22 GHVU01026909.1:2286-2588(-)